MFNTTIKVCLSMGLILSTFCSYSQIKTIASTEVVAGTSVFFAGEMDEIAGTITVTLTGPSDRWFAVGFGSGMGNADVLVYTDGKVGSMHAEGVWDYTLSAVNASGVNNDASQDWNLISNNINGGTRTIVASRDLNSTDPNDIDLNYTDASVSLVWAKSNTADFTLAYHGASNRGTTILNWVEIDTTEPEISGAFSPADNSINVDPATNLILTFNEDVALGTGNITLYETTGDVIVEQFIAGTSSGLSVSGSTLTISPASLLSNVTDYYVTIDNGAVADLSNNPYAGFSDNSTWNFATGDLGLIESISDNVTIELIDQHLTINYSADIEFSYLITDLNGKTIQKGENIQNSVEIELNETLKGVLLIHVHSSEGETTKKTMQF